MQIMAESADACARVLLRHCQSPRLLPRLCSTLCKDRSAKLRQYAAEYLIQVLCAEEYAPESVSALSSGFDSCPHVQH